MTTEDNSALAATLKAARDAYAAATAALIAAEQAATAAGVGVPARELTLERLRIVEPDGTLRLVLGNGSVGDTIPLRGGEVPHPGRHPAAGLIFVNDEGTECGGLMWAGDRTDAGVRMSFDSYEQNDALIIGHSDEAGERRSIVEFVDRPTWSLADFLKELEVAESADDQRAVQQRYFAQGAGARRMRLFRETDGAVGLVLCDGEGRERLRLVVPFDGDPRVETLDASGELTSLLDA